MPDFTAIVTPISIIYVPRATMHSVTRYSYSSTTKLHHRASFTVSTSFVPQKNHRIFFSFFFSILLQYYSAHVSKSLDRDKSYGRYGPLVLVDRPVLTNHFGSLFPLKFAVRSWA
jgi:hypothetical protein